MIESVTTSHGVPVLVRCALPADWPCVHEGPGEDPAPTPLIDDILKFGGHADVRAGPAATTSPVEGATRVPHRQE